MFPLSMAAQNYPGAQAPQQMLGQTPTMQANPAAPAMGGMSPLVKAMLTQKMGPAGATGQASPLGALGQASNPVSGALMAQRLGLMK